MRTFMQILDNRAHWKFEAETKPHYAPDIVLIDVTSMEPQPEEGWTYSDGVFMPPPEFLTEKIE